MTSRYDDLDRPPLDVAVLRRALLRPGSLWSDLRVVAELASTNAELARLARAGAPQGTVVVAEHQSAGRGRLGRSWDTQPRAGLTFSLLVRPDGVAAGRWPWLPLLAGVAVAETGRREAEVDTALKWPNDVLVGGRKLAGVLLERVEGPAGAAAVVGIGLNVSARRDELPAEATSLALEEGTMLDRSVLLRALLRTFGALYTDWVRTGGDPAHGLADAYTRRCATLGRTVTVDLPDGGKLTGLARSVDDQGRLLVDSAGRLAALSAGDVTHVRAS
ncbi:MAG TPA: biotin--[acetyl-CoA-carboxylase] ligase [Nocardioidaceae bacterium]|nr:biotin--[acetyl-CoA-carboxylase] ligase [Nocardioidaceae bacterium]